LNIEHPHAHKSLKTMDLVGVRGYEQKINILDIVKIVIPPLTKDIVKIQKNIKSFVDGDGLMTHKDVQVGKFVHKGKKYTEAELIELAQNTREYPFTILFKDFDLNLVASSYSDFRDITHAFECLINQKTRSSPNQPISGLSKMLKKQQKRITMYHRENFQD
jgi:hypothetical protein